MGINISNCKGKSTALIYDQVNKKLEKKSLPSKRDQRYKTYKTIRAEYIVDRPSRSAVRSNVNQTNQDEFHEKDFINISNQEVIFKPNDEMKTEYSLQKNNLKSIDYLVHINPTKPIVIGSNTNFKTSLSKKKLKNIEVDKNLNNLVNSTTRFVQKNSDKLCAAKIYVFSSSLSPQRKHKNRASKSKNNSQKRNQTNSANEENQKIIHYSHHHFHHHYHHNIEKRFLMKINSGLDKNSFASEPSSDINSNIIKFNQSENQDNKKFTIEFLAKLSQFDEPPSVQNASSKECCIKKLSILNEALDEPELDFFAFINKSDLIKNIEFFIQVFKQVLDERRTDLISEEEYLSDAVPNEVKRWLSMTFTRSLTNVNSDDKRKFKAVAQAIRTGIIVEKLLHRMSYSIEYNIPAKISEVLKSYNEWNFDVFSLNSNSDGHALKYLSFEVLHKFGFLSKYKIENNVMQNFLDAMETGYSKYKNPYHNLIHAADVLQTVYCLVEQTGLVNWLSSLELFALMISAIIHDYDHTGTTNNFHVQSGSDLALIYNDRIVLENYHVSSSFHIWSKDGHNIIEELTSEEYKEFRHLVIEMVLATDMSYHFTQTKTIKNMISHNETIDKPKALSLLLHCSDISHPSKNWNLHEKWTYMLFEEFFAQGDKEKELGLSFSPMCDRNNTPIAQSQIGYINFIVEPSMSLMGDMIDKIFDQIHEEIKTSEPSNENNSENISEIIKRKPIDRPWVSFLSENKANWQALADQEKRIKKLKYLMPLIAKR